MDGGARAGDPDVAHVDHEREPGAERAERQHAGHHPGRQPGRRRRRAGDERRDHGELAVATSSWPADSARPELDAAGTNRFW